MNIAVISFCKKNSKRLPGKNMKMLCGRPMLQYTLDAMNWLAYDKYLITDWDNAALLAFQSGINVIYEPDNICAADDITLNYFAHDKIKADAYIMLQPSNPVRYVKLLERWARECVNNYYQSAYAAVDGKATGNYYWYTKEQLAKGFLADKRSKQLNDTTCFDVDTAEDFAKVEKYMEKRNAN